MNCPKCGYEALRPANSMEPNAYQETRQHYAGMWVMCVVCELRREIDALKKELHNPRKKK